MKHNCSRKVSVY